MKKTGQYDFFLEWKLGFTIEKEMNWGMCVCVCEKEREKERECVNGTRVFLTFSEGF
jgi:hypothetical protein